MEFKRKGIVLHDVSSSQIATGINFQPRQSSKAFTDLCGLQIISHHTTVFPKRKAASFLLLYRDFRGKYSVTLHYSIQVVQTLTSRTRHIMYTELLRRYSLPKTSSFHSESLFPRKNYFLEKSPGRKLPRSPHLKHVKSNSQSLSIIHILIYTFYSSILSSYNNVI